MGSNQKETQARQKENFEKKLEVRLSFLAEKGIESSGIAKDALVKKLKANIRAINGRLAAIAATVKRTEELATIKAEKAAAPPKEEVTAKAKKAAEAPEGDKEKKKKKVKTESEKQEGQAKAKK
jgi:hypothetical protein